MADKPKQLFLLGGRDLEMITIKALLTKGSFTQITNPDQLLAERHFADFNLAWDTAHWEKYETLISEAHEHDYQIYGVELFETPNYKKPDYCVLIDHHNGLPPRPSSMEQIAQKLDIDISTRHYQLVIHNDVGHIKGMRVMGALKKEVEEIRKLEWEALGLTEKDRETADKDWDAGQLKGGVKIVSTKMKSFIPICDKAGWTNCWFTIQQV